MISIKKSELCKTCGARQPSIRLASEFFSLFGFKRRFRGIRLGTCEMLVEGKRVHLKPEISVNLNILAKYFGALHFVLWRCCGQKKVKFTEFLQRSFDL